MLFWFRKRILEKGTETDILRVRFADQNPTAGQVPVDIAVPGVHKPLFGFLKSKLIFDDGKETRDILLDRKLRKRDKISGRYATDNIELDNVRDYRIESSFIFFEDVFHFFSLPFYEKEQVGVFTGPARVDDERLDINTDKAEDPIVKVIRQKFSKGELLDYKKYAPGDDIRRIIWKNYARSRELTVRIPDRNFPYVSNINVLASFYDGSPADTSLELKQFVLDIYKEKLRQIVDSILEQEFTVKLFTDQTLENHYQLSDEYQQILHTISVSTWQKSQPIDRFLLNNYHKLRGGTNLVVFSSFCPSADLERLRSGRTANLNLCFYDVDDSLQRIQKPSIFKRLLFVDALEPFDEARRKLSSRSTVKYIDNNGVDIKQQIKQTKIPVLEV